MNYPFRAVLIAQGEKKLSISEQILRVFFFNFLCAIVKKSQDKNSAVLHNISYIGFFLNSFLLQNKLHSNLNRESKL
jgi:hypothetical protein